MTELELLPRYAPLWDDDAALVCASRGMMALFGLQLIALVLT